MEILKDKKARKTIEQLENRISELEKRLTYKDRNSLSFYMLMRENLDAEEIIRRFNEIYRHLGVERETSLPESKLSKITKAKKD